MSKYSVVGCPVLDVSPPLIEIVKCKDEISCSLVYKQDVQCLRRSRNLLEGLPDSVCQNADYLTKHYL